MIRTARRSTLSGQRHLASAGTEVSGSAVSHVPEKCAVTGSWPRRVRGRIRTNREVRGGKHQNLDGRSVAQIASSSRSGRNPVGCRCQQRSNRLALGSPCTFCGVAVRRPARQPASPRTARSAGGRAGWSRPPTRAVGGHRPVCRRLSLVGRAAPSTSTTGVARSSMAAATTGAASPRPSRSAAAPSDAAASRRVRSPQAGCPDTACTTLPEPAPSASSWATPVLGAEVVVRARERRSDAA